MSNLKIYKYRNIDRPIDGLEGVTLSAARKVPGIVWIGSATYCLAVHPDGDFYCDGPGFGNIRVNVISVGGAGEIRWDEPRENDTTKAVADALGVELTQHWGD